MNTAPSIRRQSIMDSGTGAPPPPSSSATTAAAAAATTASGGSGRPTFLVTPAPTLQQGRRSSVVVNNNSVGGTASAGLPKPYENTYRTSPDKQFSAAAAKTVLQEVMEEMLAGKHYDNNNCKQLASSLADAIKKRMKEVGPPRYKFVTNVALGQADNATLAFASRCVWNDSFDSFAEYVYKNGSLYAVGLVHALYYD